MFLSFFLRPQFGYLRQVLQQVRDGVSDPYMILHRSPKNFQTVPLEIIMQHPLLLEEGVCRMRTWNRPWFSKPFRQYHIKFMEDGSWKIEMVGQCATPQVLDGLMDIISSLFGNGNTVKGFSAWWDFRSLTPVTKPVLHRWSLGDLPVITLHVSTPPSLRLLLLIHFSPDTSLQN